MSRLTRRDRRILGGMGALMAFGACTIGYAHGTDHESKRAALEAPHGEDQAAVAGEGRSGEGDPSVPGGAAGATEPYPYTPSADLATPDHTGAPATPGMPPTMALPGVVAPPAQGGIGEPMVAPSPPGVP